MVSNFTEKDTEKVVEFLNFVATKASFSGLKVSDVVQFYGLLAYCQKELLKKIEDNILEVKQLRELTPPEAINKSITKKKKS